MLLASFEPAVCRFIGGVPTIPRARVDPRAPRSMVWVTPALTGASPPGRGGCAAAVVGDMCLFIGGADRSPRAFDDLWILRLSPDGTGRWVRKSTTTRGGARLPPRSGASATAVGRKVYVFGGQCPERGTCFNDVVVLDCDSWEWSRLPVSGASPPPRNAHVACSANNGRLLVIHGGSSPEEGPMGDVHVLDLEEGAERWVRPTVRGQAPEPREMHAAAAIPAGGGDADELLILGGRGRSGVLRDIAVLNLDDMAWTRRGDLGRAVCAHTAVPWRVQSARAAGAAEEADVANAALVFGGFDGAAVRPNELFAVEASTLATITLHPGDGPGGGRGKQTGEGSDRGRAPEGRFAHACAAVPRTATTPATAVIFAGVTPGADLADAAAWSEESGEAPEVDMDGPAPAPASDLD